MDLELAGETVVVTASTSGLGYGVARAFAAEDANVVLNGRDADRLAAARADLEPVGDGTVAAATADITDPDEATDPVDAAVERFGTVDHLVTNSGGVPSGRFEELDDAEWQAAFDELVMSVVRIVRAATGHLVDGGGTITALTSRSVKEPHETMVLSSAVRPCVAGLVKTLSRELAPAVRANVVLPGPHETDGLEEHVTEGVERGTYDSYEAGLAELTADVPLGRAGDPEEFGNLVAVLCSERAGYVTGEALLVEGGSCHSVL
jgi:NAD(P)-dependent dehydrogenase (short-subunit alcohol dehydrogenase family)